MDKHTQIKTLINGMGAKPNALMTAEVVSVEGESCTVKLNSGLEVSGVRLKATENESEDYLILEPAVGSDVLVMSQSGELEGLVVLRVDKVNAFKYKQNKLEIVFNSETRKVQVKNGEVDLKTIMDDLVALLKTFKVATPAGPSGAVLPDTMTQLNKLGVDINKILF